MIYFDPFVSMCPHILCPLPSSRCLQFPRGHPVMLEEHSSSIPSRPPSQATHMFCSYRLARQTLRASKQSHILQLHIPHWLEAFSRAEISCFAILFSCPLPFTVVDESSLCSSIPFHYLDTVFYVDTACASLEGRGTSFF